jgi:putative intracellular protease/amidase
VVRDGLIITGQNPPSSEPAAKALLDILARGPATTGARPAPES